MVEVSTEQGKKLVFAGALLLATVGILLAAVFGFDARASEKKHQARFQALQGELTACEAERGEKGKTDELRGQVRELQAQLREKDLALRTSRGTTDMESPPPDPPVDPPESVTMSPVTEGGGLRVEYQDCNLRGDIVGCSFLVTSETDRTMYLRSSRLVEMSGKELGASMLRFGSDTSKGGLGGSVSASMVRKVPLRVEVEYTGVDPTMARTEGIRMIEMSFDAFPARFQNVRME